MDLVLPQGLVHTLTLHKQDMKTHYHLPLYSPVTWWELCHGLTTPEEEPRGGGHPIQKGWAGSE